MEPVVVAAAQPPQQGSDLPSPSIISPIHNPMLSQQLAKDASTGNKLPLLANEESYGKRQLSISFLLLLNFNQILANLELVQMNYLQD